MIRIFLQKDSAPSHGDLVVVTRVCTSRVQRGGFVCFGIAKAVNASPDIAIHGSPESLLTYPERYRVDGRNKVTKQDG